ncbi:hypothetical protein [Mycobacterium sp. IDR2000157661]|nr:hypothetical protein [Mycobacterium sp. IDR2000157661]
MLSATGLAIAAVPPPTEPTAIAHATAAMTDINFLIAPPDLNIMRI